MENKFIVERRNKFKELLNEGDLTILFAGKAPRKSNDENYEYTPNRNFYYLSNVNEEDDIYVSYKSKFGLNEMMFIHRYNEHEAKWIGEKYSSEKVRELSGIQNIYYLDEFEKIIASYINNAKRINLDLERQNMEECFTSSQIFANKIKEKYPSVVINNIYDIIASLRMVKDEIEIAKIKNAIEITNKGILKMMQNSDVTYEYQLEAYFDFVIKQEGASDFAFKTIAASGINATVLHYSQNNTKVNKNDLILFDLGAEYQYYKADITRTFPLSGKFSDRQKLIYNIVLEGQKEVMKNIKPGITTRELNQILIDFYAIELKKIGLIKEKEEVGKYYFHGVSHHLGLDTHDACIYGKPLEVGNIITVEPGLYIAKEGIGIRIEDDVLITESGYENLSSQIIKTVEDIENFMAGK